MLLGLLIFLLVGLTWLFLFFRSTKEFPKSWREFKIEIRTIFCGMRSQNEDFILRKRNRIKLFSLPNRVAVITGGNRGIGLHVVEMLLKCDITVIMGVRNPEAAKSSVESSVDKSLINNNCNIYYEQCDTGDLKSVEKFAERVKKLTPAVHILINNAGIMGGPYKESVDGFENQMAVNYLGHFLLSHLLLPLLVQGTKNNEDKNVRIVNVTSCVHRVADMDYDDFHCKNFYYGIDAYGKSKLAQVYYTKHLEKIFQDRGLKIQAHAPHPGIVNTDLFEHSSNTYIPWFKDLFYKHPKAGARTIVYAAISPHLEGKGGTYLSNCFFDISHPKAKRDEETKKLFDFTCQLLKIKSFGEA